jgi:tripeptidyl-peptidase-1
MPYDSSQGSLAVPARSQCNSLPLGEVSVSINYGRPWTTGGGFSSYTPSPDWQTDAVTRFLKFAKYLPPASYFNASGRAYPDISAIGSNVFMIDMAEAIVTEAGTSASAPLMAAIISLLNDARMQAGKSSLGFVNRWFYQLLETAPDAFNGTFNILKPFN